MIKKAMAQFDRINELNIALVAYQMWEKAGYPTGQDMEFWLQAEAKLCADAKAVSPEPHLVPVYASRKASSR